MILITGVSGFLGGELAKTLVKNGASILGISRTQPKYDIIPYQAIDLSDKQQVASLFNQYEIKYVIHCAAKSSAWGTYQSFYDSNVLATENLMIESQKHQVKRFVHISSPSVYAQLKDQTFVEETTNITSIRPLNYYIETKKQAEMLVKKSNLSFNIIRPRALIGVGDTSVVPRLIKVEKKLGIPLFNSGQNLMDVSCIENVVHACILALESKVDNGIYNITDGNPITFQALIEMLYQQFDLIPRFRKFPYQFLSILARLLEALYPESKEPPLTLYTLSTIAFTQTLSIEKAKKELGYQPIVRLEERIGEYSEWYRRYL